MSGPPREPSDSQSDADSVNLLYSVLADESCRHTLQYLHSTPDDTVSVEDLIDYTVMQRESADNWEHAAIKFHHVILPQLEDAGYIDYDEQSNTVWYRRNSLLKWHFDRCTDTESEK